MQEKINEVLMKGCHCKTGCKSKVCGCRKKCGPGCDCDCCTNLPSVSCPLDQGESGNDRHGQLF